MIFIVLNNYPGYPGGVENAVRQIVDNLSKSVRNKIIFICNNSNKKNTFYYKKNKCINLKSVQTGLISKVLLLNQLIYSYKIYIFLLKNVKKDDIVNIHGIEYSFFTRIFKKKFKTDFRLILTVHGSIYKEYYEYIYKGLPIKYLLLKLFFLIFQWYYRLLDKIYLNNIDFYIFITKHLKEYFIKKYNIEENKSEIIPNGIKIIKKYNKNAIKDYNIQKAIIVGSTVLRKGLDTAIEIVRKVNEKGCKLNLTIIGFKDFTKYYDPKELPTYIKYIGVVKPNSINRYFQNSDFLLLPSRHEGFPLSILESLQNMKPVISSEASRMEEIDCNNKLGYIVKTNSKNEWCKRITQMLRIFNYHKFLRNIQKYNFRNYSWKYISKKYGQIYSI